MKRIAIAGPGAVAGIVSWHLAKHGIEHRIAARAEAAEALNREGITLIHGGREEQVRAAATSRPEDLGPQDIVFTGFKAHHWRDALPLVTPLIGRNTTIVPLLNGVPWWFFQGFGGAHEGRRIVSVDPDGALMAAIDPARIVGAAVYVGASRDTPTRFRWNGRRIFKLGDAANGKRLAAPVADLMQSAGLNAQASENIRGEIWTKLLGNVTFNPMSVVAGASIGGLTGKPGLQAIARAIMEETAAIGVRLGLAGSFPIADRLILSPEMITAKTSMLQDHIAGRPLELGALVYAVVELGEMLGLPTPMTSAIGALAAERQARRLEI